MTRHLPPDPSLRFIQKEAKDLLKAHRRGEASVCAILRGHPRFTQSSAAEIRASNVSLQEMQHALALDYGFTSWAEMKAVIEYRRAHPDAKPGSVARNMPSPMAKCRLCDRTATIHVTDIRDGKPEVTHYCEAHTPPESIAANLPQPDLTISLAPGQLQWKSDGSFFVEIPLKANEIADVKSVRLHMPWLVIYGKFEGGIKDGTCWTLRRGGPEGKPLLVRFKVESS